MTWTEIGIIPPPYLEDQGSLSTQSSTFRKGCDVTMPLLPGPADWFPGFPPVLSGERKKGYHNALQGGMATPTAPPRHRRIQPKRISPEPYNRTPAVLELRGERGTLCRPQEAEAG